MDIPPATVECYSKGTQTDPPEEEGEEEEEEEGGDEMEGSSTIGTSASTSGGGPLHSPAHPGRRRRLSGGAAGRSATKGVGVGVGVGAEEDEEEDEEEGEEAPEDEDDDDDAGRGRGRPPVLSEAERAAVLARPELQASLSRASLLVERALGRQEAGRWADILVDYARGAGDEEGAGGVGGGGRRRKEEFTRLVTVRRLFGCWLVWTHLRHHLPAAGVGWGLSAPPLCVRVRAC